MTTLACAGIFALVFIVPVLSALMIPTLRDLANFDEDTEAH